MNELGFSSINYSQSALSLILSKSEKFDYTLSIVNICLSVARIYSKLYDKEQFIQAKYLQQSLAEYQKIKLFIDEYGKQTNEVSQDIYNAVKIVNEQLKQLPLKIGKFPTSF